MTGRRLEPNPRREVDAYIAGAPAYARPILEAIREAFHAGCPEVEERIKWRIPSFECQGMLGGMAAFKKHVSFGFWKSKLLEEFFGGLPEKHRAAMTAGRFESLSELPPKRVLVVCVREAMRLNHEGVKEPRAARTQAAKRVVVPTDLAAALAKNARARESFSSFAPSHKREYVEWIVEAKRAETRARRVKDAVAWLAVGKRRNWKYEKRS